MKLNFGKRLLLFLHWLGSIVLLAAFAVESFSDGFLDAVYNVLGVERSTLLFGALGVIYVVLCAVVIGMLFRKDKKREDRGFILVDSADNGKVRIAISAVEQMVKQAVCAVDGIADMKIVISNDDDTVEVEVGVVLVAGSHVPTVTLNIQRAIRQFVELNCGVSVHAVSVSIQSVVNPGESGRKSRRTEPKPTATVQPAPVAVLPAEEPVVPAEEDPAVTVETIVPEIPAEEDIEAAEVLVAEAVAEELPAVEEIPVEEEAVEEISAEEPEEVIEEAVEEEIISEDEELADVSEVVDSEISEGTVEDEINIVPEEINAEAAEEVAEEKPEVIQENI